MISGGCRRSVSLITHSSSRHLAQRLVADLAPVGVELVELARRRRVMTSGWRSSSISVQDAAVEVVWCPANIIEMNIPVMMSTG